MTIAITGASGKLGGRVAHRLAARSAHQLLLGRDLTRLPRLPLAAVRGPAAYDDPPAMRAALTGADTLFLISAHLSGRRLAEHSAALDAAVDAGVTRVVYLSLLGAAPEATYVNARDHWATEQYLAGLPVRWTVLRPSFYWTMLTAYADESGTVRGPAGDGRVSLLHHDELADVAAAVLLDSSGAHDGAVREVTGPVALTLAEACRSLGAACRSLGAACRSLGAACRSLGAACRFEDQDAASARAILAAAGWPPDRIESRVSWFRAIALGEVSAVSAFRPSLPAESPSIPE
jgi:NAD(P)H dehydrogenase (quinone)